MKSPASSIEIETNLTGKATPLRVRESAKIWALLTDKIYSNKERATVREIWTNALDSHVDAGTSRPFQTSLPSLLGNTFTVRDFGTGMDHDKVVGLYSELGGSDKDSTNDLTGMLGIGSKAPLSLCDAFTVACFDGTEVRSYFVSVGEDGTPGITLVGVEESDEPRGVEVSIPISTGRTDKIRSEASKVALGFHLDGSLPEGLGTIFSEPAVKMEGEYRLDSPDGEQASSRWWILAHPAVEDSKFFIKQGPVLYPVPDSIAGTPSLFGFKGDASTGLVVEVPIGTADVGADRESLSYDESTEGRISAIFAEVFERVEEELSGIVEGAPNWLARCETIQRLGGFMDLPRKLRDGSRDVYLAGGSDWDIPTFLTGKRFTMKVTAPITASGGLHPLDPRSSIRSGRTLVGFPLHSVSRVRFYVLRPGTVRAVERIRRDLRSALDYGTVSTRFHVLDNPSSRQIERMMTLCGFTREQFVEVSSIEDIPPPRRPRQGSAAGRGQREKGMTGVYSLDGRVASLGEFPEGDYLWVRCEDRQASTPVPTLPSVRWSSGYVQAPQADLRQLLPEALLEWLGLPTAIIGFSSSGVVRHDPDPALELHVALGRKITDGLIHRAMVSRSVSTAIASLSGWKSKVSATQARRVVVGRLVPLLAPDFDPDPMLEHRSIDRILPVFAGHGDQLAEAIETAARVAYPELFKAHLSDADLDRYLSRNA